MSMTFNGMTVVAFESRMATELAKLIERYEGRPLVAPALREIPLESNTVAYEFGARLMAGQIDMLVLLTGVGTEALFEILKPRYPWPSIVEALQQIVTIARGAKTVAALKALGLIPTITVPEPNTWIDLVSALDEYSLEPGVRIAVQEYGIPNTALVKALEQRGQTSSRADLPMGPTGGSRTDACCVREYHRRTGGGDAHYQCHADRSCHAGVGAGRTRHPVS